MSALTLTATWLAGVSWRRAPGHSGLGSRSSRQLPPGPGSQARPLLSTSARQRRAAVERPGDSSELSNSANDLESNAAEAREESSAGEAILLGDVARFYGMQEAVQELLERKGLYAYRDLSGFYRFRCVFHLLDRSVVVLSGALEEVTEEKLQGFERLLDRARGEFPSSSSVSVIVGVDSVSPAMKQRILDAGLGIVSWAKCMYEVELGSIVLQNLYS